MRSNVATPSVPFLLLLLVALGYIAFAVLPGPRRVPAGGELPILIGVSALLVVILLYRPLRSWRVGAATYLAAGLWTVLLLAVPEGVMYFDGPLHDADQLFWAVLVPVAFWPWVTFGMLGVFGVLFV